MIVKIWGAEGRKKPDFEKKGRPEHVYPLVKEYCEDKLGIKPKLSDYKAVIEIKPGKSILDAKVRLDIEPIKEK